MSQRAELTSNTFVCPFADRCGCPVKFRIFSTAFSIKLEAQGEHSAESHVQDKVTIFFSIQRTSALQQMVATYPMVSSTTVQRGFELLPNSAAKILPCKARLVALAVVAARARVLLPFSQGEKLDGEEGSLTRLSEKFFCNCMWSSTIKVVSIWRCTNRSVWVINSRTALLSDVTRR